MSRGMAWLSARRMACLRSTSTAYRVPVFFKPGSASSMISDGSSLRGLSDVSTTKSLPLPAASPISGRLLRSRSQQAAEDRNHPAVPQSAMNKIAGDAGQVAQSIVGVGVVHNYGKQLATVHAFKSPRHLLETPHGFGDLVKRTAAGVGGSRSGMNVVDVDAANQRGCDLGG